MQFDLLRMTKAPVFCAVLFCLISSDAVVAAEWSIEPSISLREEYNDNIRFTTSPHPGVWQTSLSPSVRLSSKTEVSEVSGLAQINVNRFTGEQGLNQNDQLYSLITSLQSERNTWAMNAAYKQDSTAESERIATGVVQVRTQRTVSSLNPSWTRVLTERSSFKLDYNYQDVKYAAHINLNDYTYQQAGGTLQYQLTERDQVSLAANYSITDYSPTTRQYDPTIAVRFPGFIAIFPGGGTDNIAYKSTARGMQASVAHLFSETLRGNLLVGWRSISTDTTHTCNGELGMIFPTTNSFCSGYVGHTMVTFDNVTEGNGSSFSASLEKTLDSAKVSGFASRETNPSGSGLVETDKIGVSMSKSLTENLTGAVDAISYRTKYISLTNPGSRYYILEPKLNWRFSEWWTLDAGYRYARYEPESIANSTAVANAITSNAVYLNLTYNWPKIAISR